MNINDLSEKLSTMPPLTCWGTGKLQLTTQIFFHTISNGAAGLPNCPFSGHTPFASTRNSWWRAGRGAWHHPIWRPWRRGCAAGGTTRAAWARELFRQCRWHRHLWGTAVTLQVRDWGTNSNPNNQSKKHCDWHVAHWVQFGGSGREHWSQDGIALDAQFSMWAPTAKCRISQTQCVPNLDKCHKPITKPRSDTLWIGMAPGCEGIWNMQHASIFHNIFLWECQITRRSRIAMQSHSSAIAQGSKLSKESPKNDTG